MVGKRAKKGKQVEDSKISAQSRSSQSSVNEREDETIAKVLRNNKLTDVELDFSQDPDIPESRFIDLYTKAYKKANPRCNMVVIQFLIEYKWKAFRKNEPESTRKRRNTEDSGIKHKMPKFDDDEIKKTKKRKKNKNRLSDSEDESEHNDVCEFCEKGGELLLCDLCSASFHLACLNLDKRDIPDGEWECPLCEEEKKKKNSEKKVVKPKPEAKPEDELCYHCGESNINGPCVLCLRPFHNKCIFPPNSIRNNKIKCQYCIAKPIDKQIEKIIFYKTVEIPLVKSIDIESYGRSSYPIKKFLVKYVDYSYWEVEWIDEFRLRAHSIQMYSAFQRKYDLTKPMFLEDSDIVPDTNDPIIDLENITENDLHTTFYIYGVKPEWLQIQRIICYDKHQESFKYCIKWRDLPHINCTWENRHTKYLVEICKIKKHIKIFENFIDEACNRPQEFAKSSLKSAVYAPYETTPTFLINEEGLNLHEYQLEGLNWIRYSCFNKTNVILADEMGLGKTVQSISFLYSLYKEKISWGPFLVCAPLSTLPNWEREFETWAPDFYVVSLSMSRDNRDMIKSEEFYLGKCSNKIPKKCRKNFKFHVLLVSYEVAQIEMSTLKSIKWSVLVLDEAHRIKNKQSKLNQILANYKCEFKLLLTGTPLQNNLEELFHLLNFLSPKDFSDSEAFLNEFAELNKEAQIEKIHKMLGTRLLRRIKSDVMKEIPSKAEMIIPVDLSQLQRKYYKAILNRNYTTLVQKGNTSMSLLNILMELKKCCNHPYLFNLGQDEQPFDEESGTYQYDQLVATSSKMVLLEKMIIALKQNGHRILIFSQMTKMLDYIEEMLNHNDWKYERIDGSVPTLQRQAAIDRFNSKESSSFIFLLSTRAGGLGINLASADTVIIYDSDWNPHNDIQALSRAHRLGQSKKVMIYRYITRNSIEERIVEVAKKKMMLTHLVVHSGIGKNENLSKRELEDIIRFGSAQLFDNANEYNALEYDDAAIQKLLDRDNVDNQATENGLNEFFSSFKVVDCAVKQPLKPDLTNEGNVNEPSKYWESLLKNDQEIANETMFDEFGKGKRLRKQIKYVDNMKDFDVSDVDPDYDAESESSSSSDDSVGLNKDEDELILTNSTTQPGQTPKIPTYRRDIWKLPPLLNTHPVNSNNLTNVNSSTELRIKKLILNKLVTFGLPGPNLTRSYNKWNLNADGNCSFDDFILRLRNIFKSLDYQTNRSVQYVDKFPLDEMGSQSVLSRICLIELIKAKVIPYAARLPYTLAICVDEYLLDIDDTPSDYRSIVAPFIKGNASEQPLLSYLVQPPQNFKELSECGVDFKFNIEDHCYTNLHFVWGSEERENNVKLWWRYHDMWLLLGIAVHGYNNFKDIFEDSRFKLLNDAFTTRKEDRYLFARTRLSLIEQGLMIEEVVRKTLEMKVYLRHESSIVKMYNKIIEFGNILDTGLPLMEKYVNGNKEVTQTLNELLNYASAINNDLKNDASQISRYIISSSLRTSQLFPRIDDKPRYTTIPHIQTASLQQNYKQ